MKQSLFAASVAVLTLTMAQSARAQNMLADPGFEQELTAPDPNPNGATGWSNFLGAQFLTTNAALSGSNVLWLPNEGGGFSVPGTYQSFAATAGDVFTFSGWVYTPDTLVANSNDFAILELQFYTGAPPNNYDGGTTLATDTVSIGQPIGGGAVNLPQDTWTYASVTGTAPANINSFSPYMLNINADANSDFYFDNMSLTSPSAVPEPGTVTLLLAGIAVGFLFLRRRRSLLASSSSDPLRPPLEWTAVRSEALREGAE